MTDCTEVSKELDRLITQGHQDASLRTAVERKFPGVTSGEIDAGLIKVDADRLEARRSRQGA